MYMSELKLFKIKSPSPPLRSPVELGCLVAVLYISYNSDIFATAWKRQSL